MVKRIAVLLVLLSLAGSAHALNLELYFTDYLASQDRDIAPSAGVPVSYADVKAVTFKTADGRTMTYNDVESLTVKPRVQVDVTTARIFASPGEFEPVSFALKLLEPAEQVFITSGPLIGPAGVIPKENVKITSVEGYNGGDYQALMPLAAAWNMAGFSKELFWTTVKVPAGAGAGLYRGTITVTSNNVAVGKLTLELEVLPIKLAQVPVALGYNYSNPKDPEALAAHFTDMREHGMTTVAPLYEWHMPIYDDDTRELGQLIEAYKKAGFKQPMMFATPMGLTVRDLVGYGPVDSQRFQRKYIEVMRKLWAEVQRHDVPVIFSIGDEMTNKGIEGVKMAGQLARLVHEELPEIPTTSDMNGYMEVMAMAPYLNIATFNNGWDGIDRHNKGRQLINKDFILEVQKKGAIPWFVNASEGRFPFGFFLWKMSRYGVKGKVEWYYNLGDNSQGSVVMVKGPTVYPTLAYERSREGVDDLRYVTTLENLIAECKKTGRATEETAAGEALLTRIADSIVDDWSAYSQGGQRFPADGFDVMDPAKAAAIGHYQSMRRAVADAIIAIQFAR